MGTWCWLVGAVLHGHSPVRAQSPSPTGAFREQVTALIGRLDTPSDVARADAAAALARLGGPATSEVTTALCSSVCASGREQS
jgi:hypothetical protein